MENASLFALTLCMMASPTFVDAQSVRPSPHACDSGVNAYLAGRDAEAVFLLAQAIAERPGDPRAYYFRALSLIRLQRFDEARADLLTGSRLEARDPDDTDVSSSLLQVARTERRLIDFYRYRAHTGESIDSDFASAANAPFSGNVGVLRHKVSVPLEQLVEPLALEDWLAKQDESVTSPTSTMPEELPSRPTAVGTSAAAADASLGRLNDPFADDPLPPPGATGLDEAVSTASHEATTSGGQVPAGTLLNILGRVVQQTMPVPSADDLRDRISVTLPRIQGGPARPVEGGPAMLPPSADETSSQEEDPFGEF